MLHLIFIAIGGASGSVLRYLISSNAHALLGKGFPYGTLLVNALGSLCAGFISVLLLARWDDIGPEMKSLLVIGFLGGFTTFSAFSFETLELFRMNFIKEGIINVVLNIFLCLTLVAVGSFLGRKIW